MKNTITKQSKILLILSSILLAISIFIPIWRIELNAPQYPEGLGLLIYSFKLGGDVDIINGLNHYIGMGTLHAENFIEFTILPYIIGFFVVLTLFSATAGKKVWLNISLISFAAFGVISMVDFWRWEYNYGHNLDPHAAIIVPGMAYQPPLIGFKQLLNFGAYSVPDIGGWLFIGAGLLMLLAVMIETNLFSKMKAKRTLPIILLFTFITFGFSACTSFNPEDIKLNTDNCDFCKMTIADGRFGAELITKKGRMYKFDDLHCMIQYKNENSKTEFQSFYISDYSAKNKLIDASNAFYVKHESFNSPMTGNTVAFITEIEAQKIANELNVSVLKWPEVSK